MKKSKVFWIVVAVVVFLECNKQFYNSYQEYKLLDHTEECTFFDYDYNCSQRHVMDDYGTEFTVKEVIGLIGVGYDLVVAMFLILFLGFWGITGINNFLNNVLFKSEDL